jgi:hypothetical protein
MVVCHPGTTDVIKSIDTTECTDTTRGAVSPPSIRASTSYRSQDLAVPTQPKLNNPRSLTASIPAGKNRNPDRFRPISARLRIPGTGLLDHPVREVFLKWGKLGERPGKARKWETDKIQLVFFE